MNKSTINFFNNGVNLIKSNLASPDKIKEWSERYFFEENISIGNIYNQKLFNSKTSLPIENGLYCQKIFGPVKSWYCECKKYVNIKKEYAEKRFCEICKVEITYSNIRKYKMGFIELAYPIVNSLFLNNNYLLEIINILSSNLTEEQLKSLIYFEEYNIEKIKKKFKDLKFSNYEANKSDNLFLFFIEKIQLQLKRTCSKKIIENIKSELLIYTSIKKLKQLRILESFFSTKTCPSWMIQNIFPIIPPYLRPIYKKKNKESFFTKKASLYQALIYTNQLTARILNTVYLDSEIVIQSIVALQKTVDFIFNSRENEELTLNLLTLKPLKNLTETFEGKMGRFRHTLLGKRVDYSGRTVITTGPELRLNQCGLPYDIAVELFKPVLVKELKKKNISSSINRISLYYLAIKKKKLLTWSLLNIIFEHNYLLINRAPTLHKYSIQAFNPILTIELALHLHPFLCAGLNADFDGDQLGIHLLTSSIAQKEIISLMQPTSNMLNISNGKIILKPAQETVLGCYYFTMFINHGIFKSKKIFNNISNIFKELNKKYLSIHTEILFRYKFSIFINSIKKKLIILKNNQIISFFKKLKIYKFINNINNSFLVTNYGILIIKKINKLKYKINDIILETTPGQLLFNNNMDLL